MNKKHIVYATSVLLLLGGGTLSVIKLTSDSADNNTVTVEATTEATTENKGITTESVAEATTETQMAANKDDKKKDDNKTTSAATTEINNTISSESNGNQTVSASSGTTAPSGNGSSSGNGNSSSGNSSSGNGSSGGSTGGGSSSGGNGSSGNGSSGNGSSAGNGSSGGGNPSGPVAPVHTHDWQPVYKTIHHDEVSHMEKVLVKDAWDEPIYVNGVRCGKCRYEFPASNAPILNADGDELCPSCGTILGLTGFSTGTMLVETIHHDAVYEDKKIIDQAAYDEQVIDYYKCSCGETKK